MHRGLFVHFSIEIRQDMSKALAKNMLLCYAMNQRGDHVKISMQINDSFQDTEILIRSPKLTPELEKVLAALHLLEQTIPVIKGEEMMVLDAAEIIYAESVDRKTFVYTGTDCLETKLHLYELEELLEPCGFLRVSKSCLVQVRRIRSIKADLARKLRLTLETGEQIIVSRQYADALKQQLGVK
jgi:DNA-binding LytR/AlgR family response regulator